MCHSYLELVFRDLNYRVSCEFPVIFVVFGFFFYIFFDFKKDNLINDIIFSDLF